MSFFPETLARTRRKEALSTRIALLGERILGLPGAFENESNRKLPEPRKKQADDVKAHRFLGRVFLRALS